MVENQVDIPIPRLPGIQQQFTTYGFKVNRGPIAQEIQCLSQWTTPTLIPTLIAAGVTPTIADPTPYTVGATPRSSLAARAALDLDCEFRRMRCEKLAIIRHSQLLLPGLVKKRVRQSQISELEMMA